MLSIKEASELLVDCYRSRDCVVPHLLGHPGIGKTQAIESFAKSVGANVFHYYLSQANPTEVTGITMPDETSHTMSVYDHSSLKAMKDGDILFLDEFLQASPQVMNAALTLIQERRMSSGRMLPDVMICASSNPPGSPASIPLNVRQRFLFVDVGYSRMGYVNYLCSKYGEEMRSSFYKLADIVAVDPHPNSWCQLTPRMTEKLFRLYINARDIDDLDSVLTGNEVFSGNLLQIRKAAQAYKTVLRERKTREQMSTVREHAVENGVEIPEDATVKDMVKLLSESGLLERSEFRNWLSTIEIDPEY